MLKEDKLNREERIRLEAFNQAAGATLRSSNNIPSIDDMLVNARKIETYILSGKINEREHN